MEQQKQSQPDNATKDPSKDLVSAAGQGQREGNQQSGMQQQGNQQQGNQQQGSQQQGSQQQGGGQHASGGTPALDDLDGQRQGESAQQASEAFKQGQDSKR
ncbi:hypothetical protein LE190_05370 [Massilia oculi]|uniref:Uncharacterized protein n=1 Tax=Massilia hydrophila TaxID=3044279 RepID=A0ABS7Y6Q2_9BURK|nr:hypothetical protein [Massilia oculi]MCA1855353.1 hypothetical protein [Massilia oculi]